MHDEPKPMLPPHNDEAEMALLAAILHNNRAFESVIEFLKPQHFANRVHGHIYEAIGKLFGLGKIADPITLKSYFEHSGDLQSIGGFSYLIALADSLVSVSSAEDYGRVIYELYIRRQLIAEGQAIIQRAYEPKDADAAKQIELAESGLFRLATLGDAQGGLVHIGEAAKRVVAASERAMRDGGGLSGISTGLTELDRLIGGLRPADLVIIAARPSMGKTAMAVNIGMSAAKPAPKTGEMQTVSMFSLEMSDDQLAARVMADHTGVASHKITRGTADAADIMKMIEREPEVSGARMFIDSTPAITVGTLRSRARRFKRQHRGLDLIIVDYLQLMRGDGNGRDGNRVQEVSEITRGLKAIAKELNVPVIALSQLSRQVESREDKRPQLSDLRESGSIEQDADIVAFIYREEYYLARAEPPEGSDKHDAWQRQMNAAAGRAEIIVAKNRSGAIGTAVVGFHGPTTRFSDLDMSQPRYSFQ